MSFIKKNSGHYSLHIKATPNAAKSKIAGIFCDEKNQEYLKINIAAVADDGKANAELVNFLARTLQIPKSKIAILRGEISRIKVIKISADFDELKLKS